MTKMQKIVLLLTFYTSPWGAAKGETWEWFSNDRPFDEEVVLEIMGYIINGVDDKRVVWEALEDFKRAMMQQFIEQPESEDGSDAGERAS